jgi:hypothetical protein
LVVGNRLAVGFSGDNDSTRVSGTVIIGTIDGLFIFIVFFTLFHILFFFRRFEILADS